MTKNLERRVSLSFSFSVKQSYWRKGNEITWFSVWKSCFHEKTLACLLIFWFRFWIDKLSNWWLHSFQGWSLNWMMIFSYLNLQHWILFDSFDDDYSLSRSSTFSMIVSLKSASQVRLDSKRWWWSSSSSSSVILEWHDMEMRVPHHDERMSSSPSSWILDSCVSFSFSRSVSCCDFYFFSESYEIKMRKRLWRHQRRIRKEPEPIQ